MDESNPLAVGASSDEAVGAVDDAAATHAKHADYLAAEHIAWWHDFHAKAGAYQADFGISPG